MPLPLRACPCRASQAALDAGHQFFRSSNGVLLCEGPLPVAFVQELAPGGVETLWPKEEGPDGAEACGKSNGAGGREDAAAAGAPPASTAGLDAAGSS